MKINVLCFLLLVSALNIDAATDFQKDDIENDNTSNLNEAEMLKSDQLIEKNPSGITELNINNENNNEESLESQIENTNINSDSRTEDNITDIGADEDIDELLEMIEREFYDRLLTLDALLDDNENEQDSDEEVFDWSSENVSNINDFVLSSDNHETEENGKSSPSDALESSQKSGHFNLKVENNDSETKSSDIKNTNYDTKLNHESKIAAETTITDISNSKPENETPNFEKVDSDVQSDISDNNDYFFTSDSKDTEQGNSESEFEQNNLDDYYNELLNTYFEDDIEDFIGDNEDAYSVVDITLPRDTQFEMVKYEKEQNGHKVVMMKLAPVGLRSDEEEQKSDKFKSDNKEPNGDCANKELLMPVKDKTTFQNNTLTEKSLNQHNNRDISKTNLKDLKPNETNNNKSNNNEVSIEDIKDISDGRPIPIEVKSEDNIVEDVVDSEKNDTADKFADKSATDEVAPNSKSFGKEKDRARWCICYNNLADIPWVVRMQIGV